MDPDPSSFLCHVKRSEQSLPLIEDRPPGFHLAPPR